MVKPSTFASLFGRSPFKAMQTHIAAAAKCADQVPNLFEALCAGDKAKVTEVKDLIFKLEQDADDIKNELRTNLPRSMMLPVDRRDLLEVLDMQDSVADTAQDIAGLLVERPMEVPEPLQKPLLALAQRCIDAAGAGGGFLLGSGCIVPRYTPLENVQAMVNTAHSQPYPDLAGAGA